MIAIVITSLPKIRRVAYNTFYYFHVIGGILFLALISFHASSDFYCILPGLLLWTYDIGVRYTTLLQPKIKATLEDAGNGWYRIVLPPSESSLVSDDAVEHPLQTYYLNVPSVSKLQNHAFTANKVGTSERGAELLFRRADGKKPKRLDQEWTWKVAGLLDQGTTSQSIEVRKEGPYIPAVSRMFEATDIICITGGTGLTGAYSIADYWLTHRRMDRTSSFKLVWTVREASVADLHEVHNLRERIAHVENMSLVVHISSEGGRLDPGSYLTSFFEASTRNAEELDKEARGYRRGWVYCSGPEGLLDVTEAACVEFESGLRCSASPFVNKLDWYIARWQV